MGAELFIDSSGWYPLAVSTDSHHRDFAQILRRRVRAGITITTTNLVVAETHALLVRRVGRGPALRVVQTVGLPPNQLIQSEPEVERRAVRDWLERFEDQEFSLTDAVSFAVMADRGIAEALALDQHFATAGFRLLGGGGS